MILQERINKLIRTRRIVAVIWTAAFAGIVLINVQTNNPTPITHVILWGLSLLATLFAFEVIIRSIRAAIKETEAREAVREYNYQQQEAFLTLTSNLTKNREEITLINQLLLDLVTEFSFDQADIYLVDHDPRQANRADQDPSNQGEGAVNSKTLATASGGYKKYSQSAPTSAAAKHSKMTNIQAAIQSGEQTFGRLIVHSQNRGEFLKIDQIIISEAASSTAVALKYARDFELQRSQKIKAEQREAVLRVRERKLSLLKDMTQTAMTALDIKEMMQSFANYLEKLFEADSSLIVLWDERLEQNIPIAASGSLHQVTRTLQVEPGDLPFTNQKVSTEQPITIEDVATSPLISPDISATLDCSSMLALPLTENDHMLGTAFLIYHERKVFSKHERTLGKQAASLIKLSIARLRAFKASEGMTKELSALQTATAALLNTLDLEALLGQILDAAVSAIPSAEKGRLHLVTRETGQLQIRAALGYTDPRIHTFRGADLTSYPGRVVQDREPMLINDVHADPNSPYKNDIPEMRAIESMIIAPLILGDQNLGAISLDAHTRYAFSHSDLNLLVSFATTATAAIQNAQLHTEVQKQAITDPLTGLYNRRGFFELGRREVERARRFDRSLTVMIIDIDLFKDINDKHGHLFGDTVISGIASQFLRDLRQIDLIGRYGGDEFIILLPETDLENAYQVGERLRNNIIGSPYFKDSKPVHITISVGAASRKPQDESLDVIIDRADQALYQAKEGGRNQIAAIP